MIIKSEIGISDHARNTTFKNDFERHLRWMICQDIAKQMMDNDLIPIVVEVKEDGSGDVFYHSCVGVFSESEVKKIELILKKLK